MKRSSEANSSSTDHNAGSMDDIKASTFKEVSNKSASTSTQASTRNGSVGDPMRDQEDLFSQYYGLLQHQQNMLQDTVRTGTFQAAMVQNQADFNDAIVMDVGAGTAILSMFAADAGARRVYAVEASNMAKNAEILLKANDFNQVQVVKAKVEDEELSGTIREKMDIIVSEPMGFFLVHERMLESLIRARQRFLKPNGLIFPTVGNMYALPFTDPMLHAEQAAKPTFWETKEFFGIDMSPLLKEAKRQIFSQPVVGYFDPIVLVADVSETNKHTIDFRTATIEDHLLEFDMPLGPYTITRTCILHGIACWFDVDFIGSEAQIKLSTSPFSPYTHWYQCRFMFQHPLAVNVRQRVAGNLHFKVNNRQSYDIEMELWLLQERESDEDAEGQFERQFEGGKGHVEEEAQQPDIEAQPASSSAHTAKSRNLPARNSENKLIIASQHIDLADQYYHYLSPSHQW